MKQIIQQFDKKHNVWKVYSDFLEISAISISNTCDIANREDREKKYVIDYLKRSGLNLTDEEINALIESAVKELNLWQTEILKE